MPPRWWIGHYMLQKQTTIHGNDSLVHTNHSQLVFTVNNPSQAPDTTEEVMQVVGTVTEFLMLVAAITVALMPIIFCINRRRYQRRCHYHRVPGASHKSCLSASTSASSLEDCTDPGRGTKRQRRSFIGLTIPLLKDVSVI